MEGHAPSKTRSPLGAKTPSRPRSAPARAIALLAILGLVCGGVGCRDDGDPPPTSGSPAGSMDGSGSLAPEEAAEGAVLPPLELPPELAEAHPILSPNAKIDSHLTILEERTIESHPGDGGGRAWLEAVIPIDLSSGQTAWRRGESARARPSVPAASYQRFEIGFEVGPLGIDEGGVLFVSPEPFWSWSPPRTLRSEAPGYVTATAREPGVDLVGGEWDYGGFSVRGRALRPGERIDIVYGAGPLGSRVDEFADIGAELMIGVDANGDGTRSWLEPGPKVDIEAREAVGMVAFGPAEVGPGATFRLSLALVDSAGNRARWPTASGDGPSPGESHELFQLTTLDTSSLDPTALPTTVESSRDDSGARHLRLVAPESEGTLRLHVRGRGPLAEFQAELNPIVVRRAPQRLVWGDLHGHSRISDGTGRPQEYFAYARDVARLEVIALTDHDHWGVRPLDESPERQTAILDQARRFHDPGRFVTLPGYEWTSWLHGHRHVLYFDDEEAPIFSSADAATDRPDELWAALRGKPALTFAHHSAGEPVAVNWFFPPDPELEPVTEIASVHGVSEAADAPVPVQGGLPGYFVRDELLRGSRLGFIGSGDSHDGHPGLPQITSGHGGLAGIFTEALDRDAVHEALKRRRTFATNGIRPWMEVSIDETPMGGRLPAVGPGTSSSRLRIRYEATAPIERIDLVRSGALVRLDLADLDSGDEPLLSLDHVRTIPRLAPNEFHYVRVVESDGGVAWSSPVFGPEH